MFAVAWQIILGTWIPSLPLSPGQVAWRPWQHGLLPAGIVHGMAGLPWVVWIVSSVVRRTDPTLEDDARVLGGASAVLRLVILPRAALAAAAATLWVIVQTATEIPVSDAFMVRTFAEEVYTQLVGGGESLARAIAVTLPVWAAALVAAWLVARRVANRAAFDGGELAAAESLPVSRWLRATATGGVWLVVAASAGLPLAALVWRAAGGGVLNSGAQVGFLFDQLGKVVRTDGTTLVSSLAAAAATGAFTAVLALIACRLAARSRRVAWFLAAFALALAFTPGPLVGLGLKEAIRLLLDAEDAVLLWLHWQPTYPPLRSALYDQPSPVPAGWAAAVRLFPLACLMIWPTMRAIPRDLFDLARLDGHGEPGIWRLVLWPQLQLPVLRTILALAALAMGEVSAGKLVNPPFRDVFVMRLFDQMHYGAEPTVAAMCLMQVAATALLTAGLMLAAAEKPSVVPRCGEACVRR